MRTLIVFAAFSAVAAAQASGQTNVGIKRRQDTVVRAMSVALTSDDQIRKLKLQYAELAAQGKKLEAQIVQGFKDSTLSRAREAALENEGARVFSEILQVQGQLVMACARRMNDEGIVGTLGLQLHDSARFRIDADGQSLTLVFERQPLIDAVAPGSPADKAGARAGDVWVKANGRALIDSVRFDELMKPGSVVISRIMRSGKEFDLKPMTVERRSSDSPNSLCDGVDQVATLPSPWIQIRPQVPFPQTPTMGFFVNPMGPGGSLQGKVFVLARTLHLGGATLQPLDDDWRDLGDVQGDGLIVTDLPQGSPAEIAGLRKFDVIKQVNGEPINTATTYMRLLNMQNHLELTVSRKAAAGTRTTITVTMGTAPGGK